MFFYLIGLLQCSLSLMSQIGLEFKMFSHQQIKLTLKAAKMTKLTSRSG